MNKDDTQPVKRNVKINIQEDKRGGNFANFVNINMNQREAMIDFIFLPPGTDEGVVTSRIIMNRANAKEFNSVLTKVILEHEEKLQK